MKKFRFPVFILLILCVIGCNEKEKSGETAQESQPNIIWLVAEDQSPDWFPMYGDSTMRLPYIEMLARDGVTFENAYSPAPVCSPARSAIITGMYPTTLGTHNMRTYNAYRKDNQPQVGIPSYSPIVPDGVKMFTQYLREKGYYTSNGPKEDYNFEKMEAAWDDSSKEHHWSKRRVGQPFFSVFNFSVCHESQIWARGKDQLFISPSKVTIPPYFPDNDTIRHDLAVNYSNLKRLDNQIGQIINGLKTDGLYENSIIFFYGDHGGPFPRHKRALYETGTKVPMVIKFPKNKKAGSTDDRFISFIDLAPTVLSLAGIKPPKVMQGVAQFGKFEVERKPKYTFHSSDRFDALYDRLRAVRSERYKYIKSFDTSISHAISNKYRQQMPMMRELRRLYNEGKLNEEQSSWLHPTKPEEELYDLQKDPYELNNLADLPEMQDTLTHLRQVLEKWIFETNDLGRIPEDELMAKWLPDGKQEQLPALEMEVKNGEIRLISKKPDATILWRQGKDSLWNIYTKPLPKDVSFEAKSERIGYLDSEVLKVDSD
ncbi:sulfatase [Maribacter algarum]|uniref:Sulfatase n=1 Tax=Maribacter algarum (ex Zhang et al. 2020) TaxID=2578118 RepID=A0A5S3PPS1_9FLAO|nr:sulfatase [Maribacter algarum]TMM56671.1 sulfatase [Maribacter algarum]